MSQMDFSAMEKSAALFDEGYLWQILRYLVYWLIFNIGENFVALTFSEVGRITPAVLKLTAPYRKSAKSPLFP